MKIMFNTWSGAFLAPGGGETQLLETKAALEAVGCNISLFDQWAPNSDFEIFHQFSVTYGLSFPLDFYKSKGKKIIISPILWPPEDFVKWGHFYEFVKQQCYQADILLTNSHEEALRLSRMLNLDLGKFHKVRNGVAKDFLNRLTIKSFVDTYQINGKFALCLANIDRRKNIKVLLEACASLNLPVVSVGHIRDDDYFKELSQKFSNVRFIGPIFDKDLIKSAYQQCTLFALPSLCETPGIAALEAGSQGAKIVITSEGPTREYFGDLVTYVSPHSVEEVADGLKKELATSRSQNDIAQFISNNYNWSNAAKDTLEAYRKVLGT